MAIGLLYSCKPRLKSSRKARARTLRRSVLRWNWASISAKRCLGECVDMAVVRQGIEERNKRLEVATTSESSHPRHPSTLYPQLSFYGSTLRLFESLLESLTRHHTSSSSGYTTSNTFVDLSGSHS